MRLVSWLVTPLSWLWSSDEESVAEFAPFGDSGVESSYFDRFSNEVVVEFTLSGSRDSRVISETALTLLSDVWVLSPDRALIRLDRAQLEDFQRLLPSPLPVTTVIGDIPRAVVTSYPLTRTSKDPRREFLPFAETQALANMSIGSSWEGLPIGARLTSDTDLLVVCGLQGREWASVAFCLQLMEEHPELSIVPVANPDGYIYSWETDRLWVKNRQPTGINLCPGHDIATAAFDIEPPSSVPPCSDDWAGRGRQTPLEARAIRDVAARFSRLVAIQGLSGSSNTQVSLRGNWTVLSVPDFGMGYLLPKRHIDANYQEIMAVLQKLL